MFGTQSWLAIDKRKARVERQFSTCHHNRALRLKPETLFQVTETSALFWI